MNGSVGRGRQLKAAEVVVIICAGTVVAINAVRAQEASSSFKIETSGFANLTGGLALPDGGPRLGLLPEAEIEVTPQIKTSNGTLLAGRAVFNTSGRAGTFNSGTTAAIPEASVFAMGTFGRLELGARAGFPQSLIGFTPSEIAFTAAEFGPESGLRLDPNGQLPTRFLPAGTGARLDALTYLGYSERFYNDESPKAIYLTPRVQVGTSGGVYAAASYTPRSIRGERLAVVQTRTNAPARGAEPPLPLGDPEDLAQAALVYNNRGEALDWSTGVTWSHTRLSGGAPFSRGDTNSLAFGANLSIEDTWQIGVSATWDGASASRPDLGRLAGDPFGVVASLNYVNGPWIVGGYWQYATAPAELALPTRDRAVIAEIGASYLISKEHDWLGQGRYTDLKLYASLYRYALRSETVQSVSGQNGYVLLTGLRFSFY
jgi:porin-like protein